MRTHPENKILSELLPVFFWFFVSCGGALETEGENGPSPETEPVEEDESFDGEKDWLLRNNVTLRLSQARTLLLEEESSAAPVEGTRTDPGFKTNFWILDDHGNLLPGVTVEGGPHAKIIDIQRIDKAPTGETYFLFAYSVFIEGVRCKWVVVSPDSSDQAACADTDTDFEFAQIKFNDDGTAYYSDKMGRIRMRDRLTSEINTVFWGDEIDFTIEAFLPVSDGSLFIQGALLGTSQTFFRLIPHGDGAMLEEPCLRGVKVRDKGSEPGNQMFLSSQGELYVERAGTVCDDLPKVALYRGSQTDDSWEFMPLPGTNGDFFVEDSQGGVYAVNLGDGDEPAFLTRVSEEPYDTLVIPLLEVMSLLIVGDNIYATGRDFDGHYVLLRQNIVNGDLDDLLMGRGLVVQNFRVADGEDVYFSALDYDDAKRKLFRYSDEQGLEPVTALHEELKEIVFIDWDGASPSGLSD